MNSKKRDYSSKGFGKADFTVNMRVRVLEGQLRDEVGYIYTLHDETAVVQLDNGMKRAYEFRYIAPIELDDAALMSILAKSVEAKDTEAEVVAPSAAAVFADEIVLPDQPPPFAGEGGISAGGGASAGWDDNTGASAPDFSSPGADFSNVESGSDSSASDSSSSSDSGSSDSGGGDSGGGGD